MKKILRTLILTGCLSALMITSAFAAGPPEKIDGFICPVLGGQAGGEHGNSSPDVFVTIAGGDTTIIGPDVSVPVHATNDNGAGSPGGDHASPGDADYTAIWKK
jgi:hypothetical protein